MQFNKGFAHYIAISNEQTFAHDLINENFVYFRKIFIDTQSMMLDLSDLQFAVVSQESKDSVPNMLHSNTNNYKISV